MAIQNVLRYCILLGIFIIPMHFLLEDQEKFPIMLFGFLGITIAFWGAILFLKIRKKK